MTDLTLTEKILTRASGKDVRADDFCMARVDCAMTHDITGPLAVKGFKEITGEDGRVWDPEKIVVLFDHQVPADSLNAAENHKMLRRFAEEQNILNYDVLEGVCHQVMPEKGHVQPGRVIVGSDSHTCAYGALGAFSTGVGSTDMAAVFASGRLWFKVPETIRFEVSGQLQDRVMSKDVILHLIGSVGVEGARYCAAEYAGETVRRMSIAERMTMSNMAIEMGGKAGLIEPDEKTEEYLQKRVPGFTLDPRWKSDPDAQYKSVKEYDVGDLEPQVARPHNVDNVVAVGEAAGTPVDQVFIGSCTNGRFEDLEAAAEIMGSESVAPDVRMIVIPASREEYMKALRAGLVEQFMDAGAIVESPCCGPCMGGSFGLLGSGEVCMSTSNRNFRGRQGSPDAYVYLGSPATAAATALYGEITDPREV